jgi:hypothetical protein
MRALITCVSFDDILALTLPTVLRHVEEAWVVTHPDDAATQHVAKACGAEVFCTDAFYRGGCEFRKYLAIEEALDAMKREGWLAIMDCDIVLPRHIDWPALEVGTLYGPLRRMAPLTAAVPPEEHWAAYPLHGNRAEWPGYFQLLHADDPHLGPPPWHQTDWRHAGGGDSFFQGRWPAARKVRLSFEVLHLGTAGTNWCGRATPRLDGTAHPDAATRRQKLRQYVRARKPGADRFAHEKLEG